VRLIRLLIAWALHDDCREFVSNPDTEPSFVCARCRFHFGPHRPC